MNSKVFTQGTGRLTADVLNDWQETSNTVSNMGAPQAQQGWQGPKLVRVLSSSDMVARGPETSPGDPTEDPPVPPTYGDDITVPNRWWYEVEELSIKNPTDSEAWKVTSPRVMTAINTIEMGNTETQAMGVTLANLPSGFSLQPIADGTILHAWTCVSPFVKGETHKEFQGYVLAFSATNQFDGEC